MNLSVELKLKLIKTALKGAGDTKFKCRQVRNISRASTAQELAISTYKGLLDTIKFN